MNGGIQGNGAWNRGGKTREKERLTSYVVLASCSSVHKYDSIIRPHYIDTPFLQVNYAVTSGE